MTAAARNREWMARGMPERCRVPETDAAWESLLRLLPGYDPFESAEARAMGCYFDAGEAMRVIGFFHDCLQHTKGALRGQPLWLAPWQQAFFANLFGWIRGEEAGETAGTRRYREFAKFVPRKNGKSTESSGLGLYMTCADGEGGAEVYCAAADREQARLIFEPAKAMVAADPALSKRITAYQYSLVHDESASAFKVVSSEAGSKHGFNTHCAIMDELHAQPNRELKDVLWTSTAARREPVLGCITTSDFDRDSVCNDTHRYACAVRDGVIDDPAFLPAIYEASIDDDWTDEEVWARVNPNLGISVSLEYLRRECKKAQEEPSYENTFKRLHLNIKTQQDVRWLPLERWDRCGPANAENAAYIPGMKDARDLVLAAREALRGRRCFAGLDLSTTTDLSSLCLVFPPDPNRDDADDLTHLLWWFWVPEENARLRERRDKVPYVTWAREGLITATPGDVVDYDRIRADMNELKGHFDIGGVAYDRWNATQLAVQLQGDGFEMVQFGQGFASMSAPAKDFEALIVGGTARHYGDPVARWMASSVAVETDAAGNIKPSKKKSTERIDGVVAAVMGVGLKNADTGPAPGSKYETQGLAVI